VLIELRGVKKSFGKKTVLDGASFKIRRGEAVGIIGSSGTGKSTVLRIMAGLLAPDEGEVIIRGEPREGLLSDEKNPRLKVGMVFQSAALFDSLTVGENVGFKLYEHSDLPDEEIKKRINESLESVGLAGVEDRYPAQLSGGMKKRAALARAIIEETADGTDSKRDGAGAAGDRLEEVVMYDEPTAGLDPVASTVVEDLMRSMHDTSPRGEKSGERKGERKGGRAELHRGDAPALDHPPRGGPADFSARGQGGVGGHLGGVRHLRRSPSCGSSRPGVSRGPSCIERS
jgi:ABC-type transporter Mla maintaining outer membrane lipid asymmetry ATPase subunit MlaF